MKKYLFAATAMVGLVVASCQKESYYHTMSVLYPTQASVVFGDQSTDSVVFYSTDSYQLSSNASWMTIPDGRETQKVENAYRFVWQFSVPLNFEPNTTGKPRTAQIAVHSYGSDDWDITGYASYYQLSWLDIYRPAPAYKYVDGIPTGAAFEATDSATQISDTLKFYVYGNWTLTDGTFVHPTASSGTAGDNVVALTVEPNPTNGERTDTLKLNSRGVLVPIAFKQSAPKQEEEK